MSGAVVDLMRDRNIGSVLNDRFFVEALFDDLSKLNWSTTRAPHSGS